MTTGSDLSKLLNDPSFLYQQLEIRPIDQGDGKFAFAIDYSGGGDRLVDLSAADEDENIQLVDSEKYTYGINFAVDFGLFGLSQDPSVSISDSEFFTVAGSPNPPHFDSKGYLIAAPLNFDGKFPSLTEGEKLPYEIFRVGGTGEFVSASPIGLFITESDTGTSSSGVVEYSDFSQFPTYLGFGLGLVWDPSLENGAGDYQESLGDYSSGGGKIVNTVQSSDDLTVAGVSVSGPLNKGYDSVNDLVTLESTLSFNGLDVNDEVWIAGSSYLIEESDDLAKIGEVLASEFNSKSSDFTAPTPEDRESEFSPQLSFSGSNNELVITQKYNAIGPTSGDFTGDFGPKQSFDSFFIEDAFAGDIDFVSFKVPAGELFDVFELTDFATTTSNTGDTGRFVLVEGDSIDPTFVASLKAADDAAVTDIFNDLTDETRVISAGEFGGDSSSAGIKKGDDILKKGLNPENITALGDPNRASDMFYTMMIVNDNHDPIGYEFDYGPGLILPALIGDLADGVAEAIEDTEFSPILLPSVNADAQPLTWELDQGPNWLTVNDNQLTITTAENVNAASNGAPPYDLSGNYEILLKATANINGSSRSASTPVSLRIAEVNDAPTITNAADLVSGEDEGLALTLNQLRNLVQITDEAQDQSNPSLVNVRQLSSAEKAGITFEITDLAPGFSISGYETDVALAGKVELADLVDNSGQYKAGPTHNSITSQSEFEALIDVYAAYKGEDATFTSVTAFDAAAGPGVTADVDGESFTWNVSVHGANPQAGTGPHATRNGDGLAFSAAELSAMQSFYDIGIPLDAGSGTLNFTLPAHQNGTDIPAFGLIAVDAGQKISNEFQVNIDITARPDKPEFTQPENVTLEESSGVYTQGIFTSSDPDLNDSASYLLVVPSGQTAPAGLTVNADGTWSFDTDHSAYKHLPPFDQSNPLSTLSIPVNVEVTDGSGLKDNATFNINIKGKNDAPTATSSTFDVVADTSASHVLQTVDVDTSHQASLAHQVTSQNIAGFTLSETTNQLSFSDDNGDWKYLPKDVVKTETIDFKVEDPEGDFATAQVTLNIKGVNDVPTIGTIAAFSGATEDTFFSWTYSDLVTASDVKDDDSGAVISFKLTNLDPGSTIQYLPDGSDASLESNWLAFDTSAASTDRLEQGQQLRWKAPKDDNGLITAFSLQADDGLALSSAAEEVKLSVTPVNDTPQIVFNPPNSFSEKFEGTSPAPGTFSQVVTVAVDGSNPANESETISFAKSGADADLFKLTSIPNSPSARLELIGTADYENQQDYDITITATDNSPEQNSSSRTFKLNVADHPDQHLSIAPAATSTVFIPETTEYLDLDFAYLQDQAAFNASDFEYKLSFDSSRLTYDAADSTLDDNSDITVSQNGSGELLISTTAASTLSLSSLNSLRFDVLDEAAIGAFNFSLVPVAGDSRFEQLPSSAIIAPDANEFIGKNLTGEMDLSLFDASSARVKINTSEVIPTHIAGKFSTGTVSLLDSNNYQLPFSDPSDSVVRLIATQQDDELVLKDQGLPGIGSLAGFDLAGGDDTADLTALRPQDVTTGLLGVGRDLLKVPTALSGQNPILSIQDFELGLDKFQFGDADVVQRRDEVLKEYGDKRGAGYALDMTFASVALNLDAGSHTVLEGVSPVLDSSVFLEAGSLGQKLKVSFADANASADLKFELKGPAQNSAWAWDVATDGSSATLSRVDGHVGIHHDASALQNLKDNLVAAFKTGGASSQTADIDIQWMSGSGSTTQLTREVKVERFNSAASTRLDFSNGAPIKLEFVAPANAPANSTLIASAGADSIALLSDSLNNHSNTVFGAAANDILTASDGNSAYGGVDDDILIAVRGNGVAHLVGDDGNDKLIGGQNDMMIAGAGDDLLVARGLGNRLIGGDGSDKFVIADALIGLTGAVGRANRVLDFNPLKDQLIVNLPGIEKISDLNVDQFGSGVKISLKASEAAQMGPVDVAILQNTSKNDLNGSNFVFDQSLNKSLGVAPDTLSRVAALDQAV